MTTNENIYNLYIGTYTKESTSLGIYNAIFDSDSGKLSKPELAAEVNDPTFVATHPNNKYLYSVSERNPGKVASFSIDSENGKLEMINESLTGGNGPCHVAVSDDGKTLLAANYATGSCASIPINEDGSLEEAVSFFQHEGNGPNEERQEGPHSHSCNFSPDNRFVYVPELGIDKVMIYEMVPGTSEMKESHPGYYKTEPGEGPRHMTFHPENGLVYLINELGNTVEVLEYNSENGALTQIQKVSTLPEGFTEFSKSAEVRIHPNGKFLYASNRGHESLAIYKVDNTSGKLSLVGFQKVPAHPRHFNFDPSGQFMLVAGMDDNKIEVFKIDSENGDLSSTGNYIEIGKPVCIKFFNNKMV